MRVEVPDDVGFTPDELALIDKTRRVLERVGLPVYGNTSKGQMFIYDIEAMIVPASRTSPLSVDFRVVNRNLSGHAVIGPEKPITEKLFRGDNSVSPDFFKEIEAAVNEFIHCMETM